MLAGLSEHYPLAEASNTDWGRTRPADEHPAPLPRTVDEALLALNSDKAISAALGDVLVRGITRARTAERRAFQNIVTTWEQDHLFPRY
jgi:glutamine synthetase